MLLCFRVARTNGAVAKKYKFVEYVYVHCRNPAHDGEMEENWFGRGTLEVCSPHLSCVISCLLKKKTV